ncbi:aminopeptidase P N-terminal domain-containing protein [Candidatus Saccharibacteria bacterium]|nr:aminopeptidase P N-terminal domain-containing protein [Candidatus Saccharibacteria bacterium]
MTIDFDTEFFIQNRQRLRTLFAGTAPIVLTANGIMQRNSDVAYPFRQDSNFWYLTGIDDPDILLVMDKDKDYLIIPDRDDVMQRFEGEYDIAKLSQKSGISTIVTEKAGWKQLSAGLRKVQHIATLVAPQPYIQNHSIYTNPARARLQERLKETKAGIEFIDLRQHLTQQRAIKQPQELQAIQTAIDLTSGAIQYVQQKRDSYKYEYEIEADISSVFKKAGSDHAFSPIVASGASACTIHHVANSNPIDPKGLLVLDIGAEISNYAADITRTIAVGAPTNRQQAIFGAVLDVQKYALGELKPGVLMKEYENKIEHYMGEKLRELGLITIIETSAVRKYYPHATSHFLGLDTHDVGEYDRPLSAGMVVTCEPGIYIPEEGIGIRIEDDILITEAGNQNLSKALSVQL